MRSIKFVVGGGGIGLQVHLAGRFYSCAAVLGLVLNGLRRLLRLVLLLLALLFFLFFLLLKQKHAVLARSQRDILQVDVRLSVQRGLLNLRLDFTRLRLDIRAAPL